MTLARLLAAALVLCALPAIAQDQQPQIKQGMLPQGNWFFDLPWFYPEATPSEPWRIIRNRPADLGSRQNALDPTRLDQYRLDQIKGNPHVRRFKLDPPSETLVVNSNALDADNTCYAIRSYVVARDSKDSDSTHPAGYSTCRPSNRYQVRSAEIRVNSSDR
jgi:hypothetical protein